MIIRKNQNDYSTFDIDIIEDNKVLSIYQTGLDINLSCRFDNYCKIATINFNISSDQGELYNIFNKLYENIISGNILDEDASLKTVQRRMKTEKNMSYYKELIEDDGIIILSDAYPKSCPNILKINKVDEVIMLSFTKKDGEVPKMPYCIPVHIRQSGSRICEFCIPFKTLFYKLQDVADEKEVNKTLKKVM